MKEAQRRAADEVDAAMRKMADAEETARGAEETMKARIADAEAQAAAAAAAAEAAEAAAAARAEELDGATKAAAAEAASEAAAEASYVFVCSPVRPSSLCCCSFYLVC